MRHIFTCAICQRRSYCWPRNPWPVRDEGQCCEECDVFLVLPARIALMLDEAEIEAKEKGPAS